MRRRLLHPTLPVASYGVFPVPLPPHAARLGEAFELRCKFMVGCRPERLLLDDRAVAWYELELEGSALPVPASVFAMTAFGVRFISRPYEAGETFTLKVRTRRDVPGLDRLRWVCPDRRWRFIAPPEIRPPELHATLLVRQAPQ